MPQLDFHNPLTISQVVWMFLIFGTLYLLMARWALPLVTEVVDSRAARIAADLEIARTAKAQADAAVAELTASMHSAHVEAQTAIAAALTQAKEAAAREAHDAHQLLDKRLNEAESRIDQARQAAMGALRQVAAETTHLIIDRVTGQAATATVVDNAVDQALLARGYAR